jgi:hypothetical protein
VCEVGVVADSVLLVCEVGVVADSVFADMLHSKALALPQPHLLMLPCRARAHSLSLSLCGAEDG